MNPLDMALQAGLIRLISMAGTTATLADGSAVRGILEPVDDEEAVLNMQGVMNTNTLKVFSFQSVKPIPQGFREVVIDGDTYNVNRCQKGQGDYLSYLTLKEI